MKKRLLSLILAMALVCALLPTAALAAGDFQITDGVLVKYTGPGGDAVIPNGVTEIGDYAFHGCTNLTSVTIPDSVTSIGERAFEDCKSLTSVTIPDGVTSIGDNAFSRCYDLTSVTIPSSVTSIGNGAFLACNGLTSVTIPDSVTFIGGDAFWSCYNLTSVTIPDSVTTIWGWTFENCTGLTSVTIGNGVTAIRKKAFSGCTGLTSVTIGNSVTSIEHFAFYGCTGLTSVTIPDSVTEIGWAAFDGCTGLTDVYYGGTEAQWKEIGDVNDPLHSATIHYSNTMPTVTPTAYASTQSVLVDGKAVEFQAYALKDANGNDTNYIKLRDVAQVLNGSAVQFNVGWNGAVNIEKGKAYLSNGSEMSTPFSGNRDYETATAETRINGSLAALDAIVLKDDAGGAYTYYKLRDLGTALGFTVGWSADKGIYIETN